MLVLPRLVVPESGVMLEHRLADQLRVCDDGTACLLTQKLGWVRSGNTTKNTFLVVYESEINGR